MANYVTTDAELTSIANAIRTKGGTVAQLEYPSEFVSAINAIETGSQSQGTDTSDATLSSGSEMLAGVTAYSNDVKYTGTIPSKSAATYTPSTESQTIAAGQYLSGAQTIAGDQNLIPENIAEGVSIFGVTGELSPTIAEQDDAAVNFIDYDGTILYQYTKAQIVAANALPDNPQHAGLVSQGWNWTLEQIRTQLTAMPEQTVWVGQLYATASNGLEMDIELTSPEQCNVALRICIRGYAKIDWGDNGQHSIAMNSMSQSSNQYYYHDYDVIGNYTIKISPYSSADIGTSNEPYVILMCNSGSSSTENYIVAGDSAHVSASTTSLFNLAFYSVVKRIRLGPLDKINNYAFRHCTNLESITISRDAGIGSYVFSDNYSLKTLILSQASSYLVNAGSAYCLETVSLPYGLTNNFPRFNNYAPVLKNICIPHTATVTGNYQGCRRLKKMFVSPSCNIIDNSFLNDTLCEEVVLHNNITSIGSNAFYGTYIKTLRIPDTVSDIGTSAFYGCKQLRSVVLPSSLTTIKSSLFYSCLSLVDVNIPNGVTEIQSGAFQSCTSLTKITIPSTVTTIGTSAFRTESLVSVYMLATTPPTISVNTSYSTFFLPNSGKLNVNRFKFYVPYSSDHSVLDTYKTATGWSTYADYIVEMPE